MFKKYYKAANDDIKPNRELIDKIFETAEKPSTAVKLTKFYKIGTAIAAVFVFAVGAFLYPQISKLNQTNNLPVKTDVVNENQPAGENAGISTASQTEDVQSFSIPEGPKGRMITEPPVTDAMEVAFESFTEIAAGESETVQQFLTSHFGEKDEETGNTLLFEIVGKAENMYLGIWRWWVADHSSLLCEFVLNEDFTEMYECFYTENQTVRWNTQNNMLNN